MSAHMLFTAPTATLRRSAFTSGAQHRPRRSVAVGAKADRVQQLVKRDKRKDEVVDPSVFDAPGSKAAAAPADASAAADAAASSSKLTKEEVEGPQRCRDAIDLGLEKFRAGEYAAAIELFELALELPGSGVMRMAGSVREYSCPSDGEEQAALYNMACCYARLGQRAPALTCIEGLLEAGFEDFATLRTDPDLAPVRGAELDALISKNDSLVTKLLGGKKKKDEVSSKKPWILW